MQRGAQPALAVTQPVPPLETGGQTGVIQLDQIEVLGGTAQHLAEQLPEAVAPDVLAETAHDKASARPCGAIVGPARQILGDVIDRGEDRIAGAAAGLLIIARLVQGLVEGRGGSSGGAVQRP